MASLQIANPPAVRPDVRPNVRLGMRRPFQRSSRSIQIKAAAAGQEALPVKLERRDVLLAGAALLATPFVPQSVEASIIKVENLSGFQRNDQRAAFQRRVTEELIKVLTKDDANLAARAVLHDAGTYDVETKTGGFNGSLRLELDRPENKSLKPYFDKLAKAKEAIDSKSGKSGIPPISWADLEVMGLKVATKLAWTDLKVQRSAVQTGGETIADRFGAAWDVTLGRADADSPDPEGRLLPQSASPQDVKDWFFKLGNTKLEGGFGVGKAPFWERPAYLVWGAAADDTAAEEQRLADLEAFAGWKKKYDRSKKTVTRTEYEVDFIEQFAKLVDLGATREKNAYLIPIDIGELRL